MNRVISDTAEYGCYLFDHAAKPLLKEFMTTIEKDVIGTNYNTGKDNGVDNRAIIEINKVLRNHPVEKVGTVLRQAMTDMKVIQTVSKEAKKAKEPALA
jgi:ketol-acid reductoisomerase